MHPLDDVNVVCGALRCVALRLVAYPMLNIEYVEMVSGIFLLLNFLGGADYTTVVV